MSFKRVFISGGAGVIGRELVEKLLSREVTIFVGDLKSCPPEWRGKLLYRRGDLNTISREEISAFAPDLFIHLAATFERSAESPAFLDENFHHNIRLSHHLLSCLKECSSLKKIVFASSYLVYDPTLYLIPNSPSAPEVLHEDSAVKPRNLCGAAKLFHEEELRLATRDMPVNVVSARIFRVYGRGSRDVISRWIQAAIQNETLNVYHSENLFDYIYAEDVAEALLRLSQSNFSGIVNVGSGQSRSVSDVLSILRKNFPKLNISEEQAPPGDLFEASQADISRLTEVTGWSPEYPLEAAIPKLIAFEKRSMPMTKSISGTNGVLITSISKKVPLIKAVFHAAEKIGSFNSIHGSDCNPDVLGKYFLDHFWNCPQLKLMKADLLLDYCQQHQIRAIIPTRDAELTLYASLKKDFAKKHIHIMVSDPETINRCMDKKEFADWLNEHSFPGIPTALSIKEIQADHYVVKERFGAGSRTLGLRLNAAEAHIHSKHLEQPIYQPYIEGFEYSVDLYRDKAGNVKGCVARERNIVIGGESQVTTTVHKPEMEKLCIHIAHALDLYGHAVFQLIESNKGSLHIVECNPRFGGASTASVAAGLDSFYWFLLESLGESLQNYPFFRHTDVKQVRYPADRLLHEPF